ncbi:MAG TPA: RNA polymerase sigma factor [Nocardioides sp.]|uniref:RNA polymerase sigma factor n=1 Tax=Nocardioides sp. TaxID=35761 RepID=UPI002F3FBCE6
MSEAGTAQDVVQRVWRDESARLVGALTRMTRDLALAEDLAQDALVAALQQWPRDGVPDNPAAWLMQTAKRRAVDSFRRADTLRRRTTELGHALEREEVEMPDLDAFVDHIDDDVLRLIFLTCHPALSPESRAALTLRLVGGLTVPEIARAFLTKDATVGQRISRAKKTLEGESFDLPTGREREQRLDDVMGVLYLIFNEGYTATAGDDWMRPDLCSEGIRLTRMLAGLAPQEPEVHGLLALMELQASRLHARTDNEGRPVLLEDQDRSRWDELMIRRGLAALDRAMSAVAAGRPAGPYVVQAQIAACHARAAADETDWRAIAQWYDVLARLGDNPVVQVNRAVALGRAYSPEDGLAVLDDVADHRSLAGSHLVPAVRGDLLARAGRHAEAATEFDRAAALTGNEAERAVLTARAHDARSQG